MDSFMFGFEGSPSGKNNIWGHAHDLSSISNAANNPSCVGGNKWSKLITSYLRPHALGGNAIVLDGSDEEDPARRVEVPILAADAFMMCESEWRKLLFFYEHNNVSGPREQNEAEAGLPSSLEENIEMFHFFLFTMLNSENIAEREIKDEVHNTMDLVAKEMYQSEKIPNLRKTGPMKVSLLCIKVTKLMLEFQNNINDLENDTGDDVVQDDAFKMEQILNKLLATNDQHKIQNLELKINPSAGFSYQNGDDDQNDITGEGIANYIYLENSGREASSEHYTDRELAKSLNTGKNSEIKSDNSAPVTPNPLNNVERTLRKGDQVVNQAGKAVEDVQVKKESSAGTVINQTKQGCLLI